MESKLRMVLENSRCQKVTLGFSITQKVYKLTSSILLFRIHLRMHLSIQCIQILIFSDKRDHWCIYLWANNNSLNCLCNQAIKVLISLYISMVIIICTTLQLITVFMVIASVVKKLQWWILLLDLDLILQEFCIKVCFRESAQLEWRLTATTKRGKFMSIKVTIMLILHLMKGLKRPQQHSVLAFRVHLK